MAFADILTPKTIQDADDARLAQQSRTAALQSQQLNMQTAQEELANKRRAMAISMLNGIANDQDPAEQAALYAPLKPMAERYDTTLKLPDQYDPVLARALVASQISPKEMLNLSKPDLPQGYRMNPLTGKAELIPGVDESFGKR